MTRRQRQGKGGKDHHGCGKTRCWMCHPAKNSVDGREPTRQEKAATIDREDDEQIVNWQRDVYRWLADRDLA